MASKRLIHERFDLDFFCRLFPYNSLDRLIGPNWTIYGIASPWEMSTIEQVRRKYEINANNKVATDVFVLGKGEPDDPSATKIGGQPFRPGATAWPTEESLKTRGPKAGNAPLAFLAQINFADSKDIVPTSLPGTVLVVFVPPRFDVRDGGSVYYEWYNHNLKDVTTNTTPSGPAALPECLYGVRHRTFDSKMQLNSSPPRRLDRIVTRLPALKIGGLAALEQSNAGETLLCQIPSLYVIPGMKWPFGNQKKCLTEKDAERLWFEMGDNGKISFVMRKNDTVKVLFWMA